MRDLSKYEILYDREDGVLDAKQFSGVRTKKIIAGDYLEAEIYPITKLAIGARREAKRRASTPAMTELNKRNRRKKFRRLMEANFDENDVHVTLTYNYGVTTYSNDDMWEDYERRGLPLTDAEVKHDIQCFRDRLDYRLMKLGADKHMDIYAIESTKAPDPNDPHPMPPRYHIHMIIKAAISRDELEKIWGKGYANTKRLDFRQGGLAHLARYLAKGARIERRWGHTRNLKQPTVRISDRTVSKTRTAKLAADLEYAAKEILESVFKGYRLIEQPLVRYSDFTAGAYIECRLEKIKTNNGGKNNGKRKMRDVRREAAGKREDELRRLHGKAEAVHGGKAGKRADGKTGES